MAIRWIHLLILLTVSLAGCTMQRQYSSTVTVTGNPGVYGSPGRPIMIDPRISAWNYLDPEQSWFGPKVNQRIEVTSDVPLKLVPITEEEFEQMYYKPPKGREYITSGNGL
jgi:hypothetical protein